jgi:hypothetical protein
MFLCDSLENEKATPIQDQASGARQHATAEPEASNSIRLAIDHAKEIASNNKVTSDQATNFGATSAETYAIMTVTSSRATSPSTQATATSVRSVATSTRET